MDAGDEVEIHINGDRIGEIIAVGDPGKLSVLTISADLPTDANE